ncbi:MAG: hypothetical protein FGM15_02105 [Chthoniobacterales bacterium]|nr:hypothetical protein [Chthoniobacterales bacterium]
MFHAPRRWLAALLITVVPVAPGRSQPATNAFYAAPIVGGQAEWVVFANDVVGWRPFANAGFFGSSTVIANIEAGLIWPGHEVFIRPPGSTNGFAAFQNTNALNEYDFHATMVGHVLAGSGYNGSGYTFTGLGMAPQASVVSAGIATDFSTNNVGSFETSYGSVVTAYKALFTGTGGSVRADVINSSWGGYDPSAESLEALALDGLAAQNPNTSFVVSAGNSDVSPVGWPASGFNNIGVGSVGSPNFLVPSAFSSRGLDDFYNPVTGLTVVDARVGVDVSAPGEVLYLAAYLGDSGGIGAGAPSLVQQPPPTNLYFYNMDGTSFAAPVVAGGIAVLKDVANRDAMVNLVGITNAQDSRVVKSVVMAGAIETVGWNNAQSRGTNGAMSTAMGLDPATGAGSLDLGRSSDAYFFGTRDIGGSGGGVIADAGWDFGSVGLHGTNDYQFGAAFSQDVELTVSLNWFAGRAFDMDTNLGGNLSFADLNLEVWEVSGGSLSALVGRSATLYNNSEYLRLDLSGGKTYGLRVTFDGMVFDQTPGVTSESYGLSWIAAPYDTLYWNAGSTNAGLWNGLAANWNTSPPGISGTAESITKGLDQLVISSGTNNSATVTVSGSQLARGLVLQDGMVSLAGTNSGSIYLQTGGITAAAGISGNSALQSSVSLVLSGDQSWQNSSAYNLQVGSAVSGTGDVSIKAESGGSIVISGPLNQLGSIVNNGSGTATNTVSGLIGANVTGVTQDSATSKLVIGAGIHSYTGITTVAEGNLVVSGDISSSTLTSVQAGGVLSGSGTVGNTVILAGGTGSPGNSPGTMTIDGNFAWLGGGNYNWQIHDVLGAAGQPVGWDLYNVSGVLDLSALTLGSRFNINLWSLSDTGPDVSGDADNFDYSRNYAWTIVATTMGVTGFDASYFNINTGAANGTAGFSNGLLGGGFSLRVDGNNLQLVFNTAVPEPGTWAAAAVLLASALVVRYRRGSSVSRRRSPR